MQSLVCLQHTLSRWLACLGVLAGLALSGGGALAQSAEPDYSALALKWARSNVASTLPDSAQSLRFEMSAGTIDSRLRLAPCGNIEPYLPVGARLWGHGRVGLRCADGISKWNVTVPVTVKAFGNAWVVRGQIPAGGVVTQGDVVQVEVDWAEDTSAVLQDTSAWLGQTATRSLSTGQVLRQGLVRPTQVFPAGTQVRVVAEGPGFQVSSAAQAVSAGVIGQAARVRMDNGRIATGLVLDARTVKLEL